MRTIMTASIAKILKTWARSDLFQENRSQICQEEIIKYLIEGPPAENSGYSQYMTLSNSQGNLIVCHNEQKREVLIFGQVDDFGFENNTLGVINGDQTKMSGENYHLRARVLIFKWNNVAKVFPGLPHRSSLGKDDWNNKRGRPSFFANTVLIQMEKDVSTGSTPSRFAYRYVSGGYVAEFVLEEEVTEYYSHINGNTSTQGIAVTANYIVLPGHISSFVPKTYFSQKEFKDNFETFSKLFRCTEFSVKVHIEPFYYHTSGKCSGFQKFDQKIMFQVP